MDSTKQYLEVIKVLIAVSFVSLDAFILLLLYPDNEVWLVLTQIIYAVCAFALLGLCLELGVEMSFPHVNEINVNTLLWVGGQLFALAFTLLAPYLGIPLSDALLATSTCESGVTSNAQTTTLPSMFTSLFTTVPMTTTTVDPDSLPLDYRYFTFALVVLCFLVSALCILGLHTEYHRLAFDHMPRRLKVRTASMSVTYAFAKRRGRSSTFGGFLRGYGARERRALQAYA